MPLHIPVQKIGLLWETFLNASADSRDLQELLTVASIHFDKGTVARELGRVFLEEEKAKRSFPIDLANIDRLKKTRRVDGILPFDIPVPVHVHALADELVAQLELLGLDSPDFESRKKLNNEICLSYLALLHRREVQLRFGLNMEFITECPASASGGPKEEITLMAYLPNGKRITIFYSNLKARVWSPLPLAGIGYHEKLATRQSSSGLQLGPPKT